MINEKPPDKAFCNEIEINRYFNKAILTLCNRILIYELRIHINSTLIDDVLIY